MSSWKIAHPIYVVPPGDSEEFCECEETLLTDQNGKPRRVQKPRYHDCGYILSRDVLVREAASEAIIQEMVDGKEKVRFSPFIFTRSMERLAKKLR